MVHNAPECPVHYAPVEVVQFAAEQLVHIAPVYSIAYGKELNFMLSAGTHHIYVEWLAIKSNQLTFKVDNSQPVALVCGEKQGAFMLGAFFVEFLEDRSNYDEKIPPF
ncbi:MAG: hypothetical protein HGB36_02935 [Chlorobiaceae bacterium]|nr:hypothetical protein [Chlorobiaceae bacterium]